MQPGKWSLPASKVRECCSHMFTSFSSISSFHGPLFRVSMVCVNKCPLRLPREVRQRCKTTLVKELDCVREAVPCFEHVLWSCCLIFISRYFIVRLILCSKPLARCPNAAGWCACVRVDHCCHGTLCTVDSSFSYTADPVMIRDRLHTPLHHPTPLFN